MWIAPISYLLIFYFEYVKWSFCSKTQKLTKKQDLFLAGPANKNTAMFQNDNLLFFFLFYLKKVAIATILSIMIINSSMSDPYLW